MNTPKRATPPTGESVNYIDQRLQPGEKVLCRIHRSRGWRSVVKSLAIDLAIIVSAVLLARLLNYGLTVTFLSTSLLGGRGGFMAGSLLVGLVPILITLALIQDFAFTFVIELALTDRRILGRTTGPVWLRRIDLPLGRVRAVQTGPFGYLIIQRAGQPDVFISGFDQSARLAEAYRSFAATRRIDRRSEPLRLKPAR